MNYKVIFQWIIFGLLCGSAWAHQDRIIKITSDGALNGLPEKYYPARLDVQFGERDESGHLNSVVLTISGHERKFPHCVVDTLRSGSKKDIRVSASWYHDLSLLPPYLMIVFMDSGEAEPYSPSPSYRMLFRLEDGKLLQFERVDIAEKTEEWVRWVHEEIDIEEICEQDDVQSLQ